MKQQTNLMKSTFRLWQLPLLFLDTFLSRVTHRDFFDTETVPGYSFVRNLQATKGKGYIKTTSIYTGADDKEVIVKRVQYTSKNIFYLQLKNEAKILYLFSRYLENQHKTPVRFSYFVDFMEKDGDIILIRECVSSVSAEGLSEGQKVKNITQCFRFLESAGKNLTQEEKVLISTRSNWIILVSFPVYCLGVFFKDRSFWQELWSLAWIFLKNFPYKGLFTPKYVLTHRDLHMENILLTDDQLVIIDPEIAVFAEDGLELAMSMPAYQKHQGRQFVESLLENELSSFEKQKRYLAFTAYYIIQQLFLTKKNVEYYTEVKTYNSYFNDRIRVLIAGLH